MSWKNASKVVVELDNTNRIWNLDIFTEVLTLLKVCYCQWRQAIYYYIIYIGQHDKFEMFSVVCFKWPETCKYK